MYYNQRFGYGFLIRTLFVVPNKVILNELSLILFVNKLL